MLQGLVFILSLSLSGAWLFAAATYVDGHIGWENFGHQHPSELAALLAGVFAPLALLWLLVAYFRQASAQNQLAYALKQLHWQTRKSSEQTETIVRQLSENAGRARQAEALVLFDRGFADLQTLTARLALDFGRVAPRDLPELWRQTKAGDRFAFFSAALGRDLGPAELAQDFSRRFAEAPELRAAVLDYAQLQERLADYAARQSIDALVREGLEQGPPAKLHAVLMTALRESPSLSPQRPQAAESANPSAAIMAHKVAKVLWPEGARPPAYAPSSLDDDQRSLPLAAQPAPQPQPQQQTQPTGNVTPFSPLSPGFPRQNGP